MHHRKQRAKVRTRRKSVRGEAIEVYTDDGEDESSQVLKDFEDLLIGPVVYTQTGVDQIFEHNAPGQTLGIGHLSDVYDGHLGNERSHIVCNRMAVSSGQAQIQSGALPQALPAMRRTLLEPEYEAASDSQVLTARIDI
jgi:hypothetical protein